MGWLNANDAFLAMDRNENGLIDDVSELFGGMQRGQGFAKLAIMDKNVDGFLTMEDRELDNWWHGKTRTLTV